jgi:O-antigen ligase
MAHTTSLDWWRPAQPVPPVPAAGPAPIESPSSVWAYRALVAFTVVMVLAPQSFIPALKPLRLAFLSAITAIVTHIVDRWRTTGTVRRASREAVIIACLLGWAVLTLPLSTWPGGSMNVLFDQYLKSVIMFWLLANVICTAGRLRTVFWTLSLISVPLAVTGLTNYASGQTFRDAGARIAGYTGALASNPNDLALTLNIFLPLTAALVLSTRRWGLRLLALGIVAVSVLGVIITFSRGGFVTLAVTSLLSLLMLVRRGNWTVFGAVVLGGLLIVPLIPAGYADRLSTITNIGADSTGSAQERWRDTQSAVELIQAHPVTGSGLGMDTLAMNDIRGAHWLKVHNAYLDYAIDLGVPGLTLFVAVLLSSIWTARRVERHPLPGADGAELSVLAGGIRISLIGFAVAAFFHPVPYHPYFYYIGGLAVAAAVCRTSLMPRAAATSAA